MFFWKPKARCQIRLGPSIKPIQTVFLLLVDNILSKQVRVGLLTLLRIRCPYEEKKKKRRRLNHWQGNTEARPSLQSWETREAALDDKGMCPAWRLERSGRASPERLRVTNHRNNFRITTVADDPSLPPLPAAAISQHVCAGHTSWALKGSEASGIAFTRLCLQEF